ncbi:hypothetical protein [Amycolatopsis solani]|uniref:hypothetical protein n=1 Tax=Amycolatopsis solani TaxID=3028615 RepID=UPI0025B244A8|nr:hypothetical protein [Amycolatopsis sp. MEP2-6]
MLRHGRGTVPRRTSPDPVAGRAQRRRGLRTMSGGVALPRHGAYPAARRLLDAVNRRIQPPPPDAFL